MRRYLALALSLLMVSGCATYSGRPVTVPKIEAMPVWRTEGPVTVGVDLYSQPDRQKEVFDDDLIKAGVLPIYLLVRNSGERPLSLRHSDINLEFPNGLQCLLDDSETVLRMLGSWPQRQGSREELAALLILWPLLPAIIANKKATDKATEARITDYMNQEFKDVILGKDSSAHGFVYYTFTYGSPTNAKLVLRFVDETEGTSFVVRVPMTVGEGL
jgi:hypothetical protein